MKETYNFVQWRNRLYGTFTHGVHGVLSFRTLLGDRPAVDDVREEFERDPWADQIVRLVAGPDFLIAAFAPNDFTDNPPEDRYPSELVKIPVDPQGHLGKPFVLGLGSEGHGAWPRAVENGVLFASSARDLVAIDAGNLEDVMWRIQLSERIMAVLPISGSEGFISTMDETLGRPKLWKFTNRQLSRIELEKPWSVWRLDRDSRGRIWAIVRDTQEARYISSGLLSHEDENWVFRGAPEHALGREYDFAEQLIDLSVGPDDSVWVSTLRSGIGRFRNNQWETWTEKDGIGCKGQLNVLADNQGTAWFWNGQCLSWALPDGRVGYAWRRDPMNGWIVSYYR